MSEELDRVMIPRIIGGVIDFQCPKCRSGLITLNCCYEEGQRESSCYDCGQRYSTAYELSLNSFEWVEE